MVTMLGPPSADLEAENSFRKAFHFRSFCSGRVLPSLEVATAPYKNVGIRAGPLLDEDRGVARGRNDVARQLITIYIQSAQSYDSFFLRSNHCLIQPTLNSDRRSAVAIVMCFQRGAILTQCLLLLSLLLLLPLLLLSLLLLLLLLVLLLQLLRFLVPCC